MWAPIVLVLFIHFYNFDVDDRKSFNHAEEEWTSFVNQSTAGAQSKYDNERNHACDAAAYARISAETAQQKNTKLWDFYDLRINQIEFHEFLYCGGDLDLDL